MAFSNIYEDADYATAYATLDLGGTYLLAYRDLPDIIKTHTSGTRALDFGCGAGRSTRFIRDLDFDVTGCDISGDMIKLAHKIDPDGHYVQIPPTDFLSFTPASFDLITAIYPFDNIPTESEKMANLAGLRDLLNSDGKLLVLVSSQHLYVNEWATFSTKKWLSENQSARSGDHVKVAITTIGDSRPVTDILWTEADYQRLFADVGLKLVRTYKPLADGTEPINWISETQIAPWEIHILSK